MRTVLVLGAGHMQVPVIQAAKAMDLRVVAIDPASSAPGLAMADSAHVFDLADVTECLAIARACRPAGVLTFAAEYPVPTAARICQELNLPGLRPEAARRVTDKWKMKRAFASRGVPSPVSLRAATFAEALDACQELSKLAEFLIFKPNVGHGGRGVMRVACRADADHLRAAFEYAMDATRDGSVLVEQYVEGPEFSVEGFVFSGKARMLAVTDKLTSGPPHFVEIGHSQPSRFPAEMLRPLIETAIAGVDALGIDGAGIHAELRFTAAGPQVIEIAGRFGGGYIASHLVLLSTGVDLPRAAVSLAIGEPPEVHPRQELGAAIRFFLPKPGMVRTVVGVEEARLLPAVRELHVVTGRGDLVRPMTDATCRIGHVICTADNAEAAIRLAEQARDRIQIETC